MPYVKGALKNPPRTKLLDKKSQKCGLLRTVFSANGDEYTGEWKDNKKHGNGIQLWKKSGGIYNGEWKFGKQDGYGKYSVPIPGTKKYSIKYCGEWKNGKKHGYGTFFKNTSAVYEGDWSEGLRSGWGRMYESNGDIYEGEWILDKKHGLGIIHFANGNWHEGSWRDGKRNGKGRFYYADKDALYEGFWVDDVAKCGTLSDFGANEALRLTKRPIPKITLMDVQLVLREAQAALLADKQEDKRSVSRL